MLCHSGVLTGLDLQWTVVGPFHASTVRGLPVPDLDGLAHPPAPERVRRLGLQTRQASSVGGLLDLSLLWGRNGGFPHAWAFAEILADAPRSMGLSFAADWTSVAWLNGQCVWDCSDGNGAAPDDLTANQVELELRGGRNVLAVRVGGGSDGWSLRLMQACDRTFEPADPLADLPPVNRRMTRDYAATGLRLEDREHPEIVHPRYIDEDTRHAARGVQSRWIQIVATHQDHRCAPLFDSAFLPRYPHLPSQEPLLRQWTGHLHSLGMPVLTWYGLANCTTAAQAHPEWRAAPMTGVQAGKFEKPLCFHTPYGEALIDFVIEAIDRTGIDGFWFDWAMFSGKELCVCAACRDRYWRDCGRELPVRCDWDDDNFRRFVLWRQESFVAFMKRLVGRARRAHPGATFAFNHQYRGGDWWMTGWPLAPTGIEMIGGTEAGAVQSSSFQARMIRAYGYAQGEVWMGLHALTGKLQGNPAVFAHHALSVMTAGAIPSYGAEIPVEQSGPSLQLLAGLIGPRMAHTGGPAVPYAALHLSQQTGIFFSGRAAMARGDAHWPAVEAWEHLLRETQCLTDILFDLSLNEGDLAKYPVVILPLSAALSDAQVTALEQYVRKGGVLVAGPHTGCCDEWGRAADGQRMARLLGRAAAALSPVSQPAADRGLTTHRLGAGSVVRLAGDLGRTYAAGRDRELAVQVKTLLTQLAPSPVAAGDNPNVAVGLFRHPGRLVLHVQNVAGYSQWLRHFPNPMLHPPRPQHDVRIRLRGWPIRRAVSVLGQRVSIEAQGLASEIRLDELAWGDVIELDL